MAASAAALKSEVQFKTSVGGRFLTQTLLSINGEAEEYKKGGIALTGEQLGLPDGIVDVALVNLFLDEKNEKAYDAQVLGTNAAGFKLVVFAAGAEKKYDVELTEAEGKALKGFTCTVVAIGR